jgi:hypothetical protein
MPVLALPRSVRLAAWGTAVLGGQATAHDAVRAVTLDDEPHTVRSGDDRLALPPAAGLADVLGRLGEFGVPGLRVVLPAPGDVLGLPGPPAFNQAAVAARECVLTEPVTQGWAAEFAAPLGLVPQVTAFGSEWEPGAMVEWSVHPVNPPRVTAAGSLAEAERELREALITATEALARLDVARWRDDAAHAVAAVRDGRLPRAALPPSAPGRTARVLTTAARVRAIVELAAQDDGSSVTGYEAQQRSAALQQLDAVSRRALAAAVNGMLEPHQHT